MMTIVTQNDNFWQNLSENNLVEVTIYYVSKDFFVRKKNSKSFFIKDILCNILVQTF